MWLFLAFAIWGGVAHFWQWLDSEREKAWKEGYNQRRAEDRLADHIEPAVIRVNFEELRAEHIVTWEELQRFGEAAMLDHAREEVQYKLFSAASHYMKIYKNDDPRRMGKRVMGILRVAR